MGKPISIVKSSDTSKSTFTQLWDSLNKNKNGKGRLKIEVKMANIIGYIQKLKQNIIPTMK